MKINILKTNVYRFWLFLYYAPVKKNITLDIFNKNLKEMVTLSLNGYVHVWDVERFRQVIET